jgi:pre-rRNA-processing protein IPI3
VELSDNSNYCVAGGASGHAFVWDATNGELLNTWSAHYRKVTVVRFTRDGAFVITGGDDAIVNIWSLAALVAAPLVGRQRERELAPRASISAHTMPITDVQCSSGSAPLVFSSSLDRSVNVFDLANNAVVLSLALPSAVNAIALSPCETHVFAALVNGTVRCVPLYAHASDDVNGASRSASSSHGSAFVGHTKSVTSLALSHDGTLLGEFSHCVVCGRTSAQHTHTQ